MKLYGLIGFPLGHSFSAKFFTEKFSREGIDAQYQNFELSDVGQIMELLAEVPDVNGLNVTIPYKEQIMPYLTSVSDDAKMIGAVNVIKIIHNDKGDITGLEGFNSDCPAFVNTLKKLLPEEPINALVLGTGGASKAVQVGLLNLDIPFTVVSRNSLKGAFTYEDLTAEIIAQHRLIVNTTPLGMFPNVNACPSIPYEAITDKHICYDIVYNPVETLFLNKAKARGAKIQNGLEMLHEQALISWQIWNNKC